MGEAKSRFARKLSEIVASEPRCIYCSHPAETIEHMPPVGMFKDGQRPKGMEYAACKICNNDTRGADAVAMALALCHPQMEGSWKGKRFRELMSTINARAPGVKEELSRPERISSEMIRRPSGLLTPIIKLHADGPLVAAHLNVFAAKLAMALFREHVGIALPIGGSAWGQIILNAGMDQKMLDERVSIMPLSGTLKQGSREVPDQFFYRFNCDERTLVAAMVEFHRSIWFNVFASSDQKFIDAFDRAEFFRLPGTFMLKPGELLPIVK